MYVIKMVCPRSWMSRYGLHNTVSMLTMKVLFACVLVECS